MINDLDRISEYIVVFCHGGVFSVHLLYLLNQVASLKVEIAQNTFDYSFSLSFLFLSMFLSSSLSGTATPQNLILSLRSPLPSSGEAMNGALCLFLGSPVQERHGHSGESADMGSSGSSLMFSWRQPWGTWCVPLLLDPLLIGHTQNEFASIFQWVFFRKGTGQEIEGCKSYACAKLNVPFTVLCAKTVLGALVGVVLLKLYMECWVWLCFYCLKAGLGRAEQMTMTPLSYQLCKYLCYQLLSNAANTTISLIFSSQES